MTEDSIIKKIQGLRAKAGDSAATEAEAMTAAGPTGTMLVVVKGALIKEHFEEMGIDLRESKGRKRQVDGEAHAAGRADGENINLNRPVETGATSGEIK